MPATSPAPLSQPRSCIAILGVPFDCVTKNDAVSIIERMIDSRQPHYLVAANVDFVVKALEDDELRRILFEAHLVLCDGGALQRASRRLGNALPEQIGGEELVPLLIRMATLKSYRVFILGGRTEGHDQAIQRLQRQFPGLIVAGSYAPPATSLHEMDPEAITKKIKEQRPDMLFVCFGFPRQEKWIAANYRTLGVPVCIGVGATIDALTGNLAVAPEWVEKIRLAWLYRLLRAPSRLLRFVRDQSTFNNAITRQAREMARPSKAASAAAAAATPVAPAAGFPAPAPDIFALPPSLDAAFIASPQNDWDARASKGGVLFADATRVKFVDSTGMGSLVRLQKRLREQQGQLILFGGSEPLQKAMNLMRLTSLFPFALDLNAARRLVEQNERDRESPVKWSRAGTGSQIAWTGEVTAETIDRLWEQTEAILIQRDHSDALVIVDLTKVTFIDSAGLGSLVRMRRTASQSGVQLRFINPSEVVQRIVQNSRMGEYLLGEKM